MKISHRIVNGQHETTRRLPSQAHLQEHFDYDPETGIFIWKKVHRMKISLLGKHAGTKNKNGYVLIGVRGFGQLMAHRLAWIYVHGASIDDVEIDHRDTNPSNNALSNLRKSTRRQNAANCKKRSTNKSGYKGASRLGKRWRAIITVDYVQRHLGYFETAQEAHEAYGRAARIHFGNFARMS